MKHNEYNVEYSVLENMIDLFIVFENQVKHIKKRINFYSINNYILKNIFRKNCKIQNYSTRIEDNEILLDRNFHSLLNEEYFSCYPQIKKPTYDEPQLKTKQFFNNPATIFYKNSEIDCICQQSY